MKIQWKKKKKRQLLNRFLKKEEKIKTIWKVKDSFQHNKPNLYLETITY